jgi:hypothetical protein
LAGLVAGYFLEFRESQPRTTMRGTPPPMSPADRAFAAKIEIRNLTLSQAENFLNQQVTILSGDLVNTGDRSVRNIDLTLEFLDDVQQVVLRETRSVLAPPSSPLLPNQSHRFDISFEHIPTLWNMQQPRVRVSAIQLTTR